MSEEFRATSPALVPYCALLARGLTLHCQRVWELLPGAILVRLEIQGVVNAGG